jgi:hypothetical protein
MTRWLRRNGWRLAFLAALLWIAAELHRIGSMVDEIPPTDLSGVDLTLDRIEDTLSKIANNIIMLER